MSTREALSLAAMLFLAGCGPTGSASQAPAGSAGSTPPTDAPTAAAVATARPSPSPIPGCLPLCVLPNLRMPGRLAAGENKTEYFFGGQFRVTLPDASWNSREDSTGEFELHQSDGDNMNVEFWLDVYPVIDGPGFPPVPDFDGSAKALVDWIAANKNVKVDHRGPATVGGLTGEVLDFERSPKAVNVDPDCPAEIRPCVALVRFPQWDGPFDSAGPFKNRLYALDVTWSGAKHAFYAMVATSTVSMFEAFAPVAAPIIQGVQLPGDVHR